MDPRHDTQPLVTRIIDSFRGTKKTWPDPEASTGEFIRMMGRKKCFRAAGPALDAFIRFSKDIEEYLNKFSDALPETVLRTPCMIGTKEKNLRPAVLFSSSDQDAREKARQCIQESGILQKEGFISMTCNRPPEFPTLMTLTMDETEVTAPGSTSTHCITLKPLVLGSFATQISIFDVTDDRKKLATATGGGILEWDKRRFLMTAAHAFQPSGNTSLFTDDNNCDFEYEFDGDDFSDEDEDEDEYEDEYDDDEMADPTSRGSKTSEDDGSNTQRSISAGLSSTSSASLSIRNTPKPVKRALQIDPPTDRDIRSSYLSALPPISRRTSAASTEEILCSLKGPFASSMAGPSPLLDYALIEITGHQLEGGDISLPNSSKDGRLLGKREAVEVNGPSKIIALTANKGSIKGRLTGIPSFGTAPNSTVSQELWTIHLDGTLKKGDCGCWIIDAASGAVYGHIIAGSLGTGIGLVAPLKHVLGDLVRRFGGHWSITPITGSYSASNPKSISGPTLTPFRAAARAVRTVQRLAKHRKPESLAKAKNLSSSGDTWNFSHLATSMSGSSGPWPSSSLGTFISGLDNTWLSLLHEKKGEVKESLGRQFFWEYGGITSGRSFRSAFEKLSKEKGEFRYVRLEARIFPSLASITKLAMTVDQFIHLAPNDTLESLIWWISFAIIECGCRAGAQLAPLVNLITGLNKKVPLFSIDPSQSQLRFANEERIQKPLQDVYSLFIDSHLFIISYLRSTFVVDPPLEIALETYVNETARRFEELRGLYDVLVNRAAEEEEKKVIDLQQWNIEAQRTLPDYLHHDSISNRDMHAKFGFLRILGRGSYGDVDEVRELSTGASYARKHIFSNSDKHYDVIATEVRNEVAIMQKLRHLHIATVLFYLKEEAGYSIFMLPVADYDLRTFLSLCTEQGYPPALTTHIYHWFGCLLDALVFAHKLNIAHRDIKPSNILIKNNQPYLSDFGLAQDFSESSESASHDQREQGTPVYRAPEVVLNQPRGRISDAFSLGCVYSEMFTVTQGRSLEEYHAFRRTADSTAFRYCLEKMRVWLRSFESNRLNDMLVDQILHMTDGDAMKRSYAEEALNALKSERAFFCVE